MSMLRSICLTLAVVCIVLTFTPTAKAQLPGYGYPYWWGGYFHQAQPRIIPNARVIPYFALYPPVYYSHSVPRPYGFSPFALPPGVQPAEGELKQESKAKEIVNPYYKPDEEAKDHSNEVAATARMILNPYVNPSKFVNHEQFADRPIPNEYSK